MISVEDWVLIRRLVADGVLRRQVARESRIGRATVDRAFASNRPPKYQRPEQPTSFTVCETRARALIEEHPEKPTTVFANILPTSGDSRMFSEVSSNVWATRADQDGSDFPARSLYPHA